MRISYNWLKELVPIELPPEELAKQLLLIGFEVSEIKKLGAGFEGVQIGVILEVAKHPNADRLSLCSVAVVGDKLSIVCGAKNVAVGARVAVARIGAKLPGGKSIERTKIRGVESQGMLCSSSELGLANGNHEGILILPPDAPTDVDAASLLAETDYAMEVEVTPNRPDCLSHLGLARELAIHFNLPLKHPALSTATLKTDPGPSRKVSVDDKKACGRYVGRDLVGIKVAPSPGWLAHRLEAVGLRPINNAVDVTNYVLFELGQPLHAFDADKLKGDVAVRRAKAGEKLKALDAKEYTLADGDLVIADASGPIALAGVIGGEPTSVTDKTTNIFLESAQFDPGTVHRTARRLGIRTDSSYRFERGVDPLGAPMASVRAIELLQKVCGGTAREAVDVHADLVEPSPIRVSATRINSILGTAYPAERVEGVLKALSPRVVPHGSELDLYPPSHRLDLATVWDLAEEVARHLGYDAIPAEAGPVKLLRPKSLPIVELIESLRGKMSAEGFSEAYNTDFISEAQFKTLGAGGISASGTVREESNLAHGAPETAKAIRVLNPISEDQAYMRPSLLPGLLQNAAYNLSRGADGARLFEIGRAYELSANREPIEHTWLAALQIGKVANEFHWSHPKKNPELADEFYDVKGVADELLKDYSEIQPRFNAGTASTEIAILDKNLFHPNAAAVLTASGHLVGIYGAIHPEILKSLGIETPGAALLLNLDQLVNQAKPPVKFAPFSQFPSVVRDISIILDESVSYATTTGALARIENLARVDLVDVYAGAGIPQGKKSLTLRLTFSSLERTLRDAEVQGGLQRALDRLAKDCGAVLRG